MIVNREIIPREIESNNSIILINLVLVSSDPDKNVTKANTQKLITPPPLSPLDLRMQKCCPGAKFSWACAKKILCLKIAKREDLYIRKF